jgi:hypothetical protein
MKTYRNLAIICFALVILFIVSLVYTIGLDRRVNKQIDHFKTGKTYNRIPVLPAAGKRYPMTPPEPTIIVLGPNIITKQETDERGLTSVQYIKDGEEWGLDYLTKHEYDSAFCNYINYRP